MALSTQSIACDWSSVKKVDNGYLYSLECHKQVGGLVANELIHTKQKEELNKALELKDLALHKSDQRLMNWREESYKQHDFLLKQEKLSDVQKWIYFGLGVVVTGLAVHGASKLGK